MISRLLELWWDSVSPGIKFGQGSWVVVDDCPGWNCDWQLGSPMLWSGHFFCQDCFVDGASTGGDGHIRRSTRNPFRANGTLGSFVYVCRPRAVIQLFQKSKAARDIDRVLSLSRGVNGGLPSEAPLVGLQKASAGLRLPPFDYDTSTLED